ncbi:hypothetical protein, partial [Actinomyces ruminis]
VVTSIPEDLDEQQTEILKAFINYDQVTWDIWFTREGVENAEPLTTPEFYQVIRDNYNTLGDGRTDGTVRLAVKEVFAMSPTQSQVLVCVDQSDLVSYDADGNDVSNPDTLQGRYEVLATMVYEGNGWLEYTESTLSSNECVVEP